MHEKTKSTEFYQNKFYSDVMCYFLVKKNEEIALLCPDSPLYTNLPYETGLFYKIAAIAEMFDIILPLYSGTTFYCVGICVCLRSTANV